MGHADAKSAVDDGKLHFLNREQFGLLSSMGEVLIPGSAKTKAANFIDLLLSVEKEKEKKEFVESLSALASESKNKFGKGFIELSAAQQNELFTAVSADTNSLHSAFMNLREWTSGAYYSSEIGMRELGWTPDRVFAEFPGCSHAEGHG